MFASAIPRSSEKLLVKGDPSVPGPGKYEHEKLTPLKTFYESRSRVFIKDDSLRDLA
jgi:hypothetical protein